MATAKQLPIPTCTLIRLCYMAVGQFPVLLIFAGMGGSIHYFAFFPSGMIALGGLKLAFGCEPAKLLIDLTGIVGALRRNDVEKPVSSAMKSEWQTARKRIADEKDPAPVAKVDYKL